MQDAEQLGGNRTSMAMASRMHMPMAWRMQMFMPMAHAHPRHDGPCTHAQEGVGCICTAHVGQPHLRIDANRGPGVAPPRILAERCRIETDARVELGGAEWLLE